MKVIWYPIFSNHIWQNQMRSDISPWSWSSYPTKSTEICFSQYHKDLSTNPEKLSKIHTNIKQWSPVISNIRQSSSWFIREKILHLSLIFVEQLICRERVSFEPVRDFNDNFSCDQVNHHLREKVALPNIWQISEGQSDPCQDFLCLFSVSKCAQKCPKSFNVTTTIPTSCHKQLMLRQTCVVALSLSVYSSV